MPAKEVRDDWAQEIYVYETQLAWKREGRLDDKVFAETRLRRGALPRITQRLHPHLAS